MPASYNAGRASTTCSGVPTVGLRRNGLSSASTRHLERERTADRAVDLVVLTGERRRTVGPEPAHDLDALVEHLESDAGGREAVSVRASKAVMISADIDNRRSLAEAPARCQTRVVLAD
jgi:hypothetical protein